MRVFIKRVIIRVDKNMLSQHRYSKEMRELGTSCSLFNSISKLRFVIAYTLQYRAPHLKR